MQIESRGKLFRMKLLRAGGDEIRIVDLLPVDKTDNLVLLFDVHAIFFSSFSQFWLKKQKMSHTTSRSLNEHYDDKRNNRNYRCRRLKPFPNNRIYFWFWLP